MRRILVILSIALVVFALVAAVTFAYTEGYLPGGTSLIVDNTDPVEGDSYYIPIGDTSIDMTDEGTVSLAEGVAVADTTLIYVVDASGSTQAGSYPGPAGEQQTHDVTSGPDEIIDYEILSAINLNSEAVALGSVDEVAVVMFAGSAHAADARPGGGDEPITEPDADIDASSERDVDEVLRSIMVAEFTADDSGFALFTYKPTADIYLTNYGAAIQAALDLATQATNPHVIVVFMSDGLNNAGSNVNTFDFGDVVFHTFAVGPYADVDTDLGLGSLADIAELSGGTAANVPDPTALPDILPELVSSTLSDLAITLDGIPVAVDSVDPALPQEGPVAVDYSASLYGLGPGSHEICVTASGSDAGGDGSVEDCKTFNVIQTVAIDIKPGSFPNSINLKQKGVTPVAILGSETFDVATIDPATLRFGPAGASPAHDPVHYEDVNWDGYMDLVSHYLTSETGIASGDTSACITGEYDDGLPFMGCDSVRTLH